VTAATIREHLPLVETVARGIYAKHGHLRPGPDCDDLVAFGSQGLVEAAGRFDPARGVSFRSFAYYRIRGAMIDGIRQMGSYSRAEIARHREGPETSFTFVELDESIPASGAYEDPEELVDRRRMGEVVLNLLDRLPDAKRTLVQLYFFGGLQLEEIGALRGQSKSWMCRMLAQTLRELRGDLVLVFPESAGPARGEA
jgi:RNA polymerase sigma factor for flagellar operon FliA